MRISMRRFSLKKLCYIAFAVFTYRYLLSYYLFAHDNVSCYFEKDNNNEEQSNDVMFGRDNIFFHSTSCNTIMKVSHLCAMESAVRNNPKKKINILFTRPLNFCSSQQQILKKIIELGDINISKIYFETYLKSTPFVKILEKFKNNLLNQGLAKFKHVEEILKLASLYKYGGTVVNLDLIITKPLPPEENFVIRPMIEQILSAEVISLDKISGNMLLKETIKLVIHELNYNINNLDVATALTTAFTWLCRQFSTPLPESCWGVEVNEFTIFPLNFTDPKRKLPNVEAFRVEDNYYRRHFYKETLLEEIAKKYCPIVYKQSQLDSGVSVL